MTTDNLVCPKCQISLNKHMAKNLDILFCPTCGYTIEDPCNKPPELITSFSPKEKADAFIEALKKEEAANQGTKHDGLDCPVCDGEVQYNEQVQKFQCKFCGWQDETNLFLYSSKEDHIICSRCLAQRSSYTHNKWCPTCESIIHTAWLTKHGFTVEQPKKIISDQDIASHIEATKQKNEKQEGTKHDQGKLRMDLFPPEALEGITRILTFGAEKYDDRNWEKGIKYGRVFGALMRHMWAWWRGEDLDPESGCSHLWHAGCCICFLITYEARKMVDLDDRSKA